MRNSVLSRTKHFSLVCAFTGFSAIAIAQEFKEIATNKGVNHASGQPQCASLANTMGGIHYKNAMLGKKDGVPLSRMLDSLVLEPKAYQEWDRGMPDLYRAYWDKLYGNKYKNIQEAVDDLYAMCMDSSVARERDRRFK